MKMFKRLFSILGLLTLAACGGGGGNAGDPPFGGGGGAGGGSATPTAADLVLVLSSSIIANNGSGTIVATATAIDGNRNSVVGVPVTISVDKNAVVTPSGTVTDGTGKLTATVGIGSDQTNRTITVTATSGSLTKTAVLAVQDTGGNTAGTPSLKVTLSSTTITSTAPSTVTATLLDASGAPVSNGVVSFSTLRGNLATLSVASALTNAQGVATATLISAASGVQGSDSVVASANVNAVAVSGSAGFTVTAQAPTISLTPSSAALTFTTAPLTLTASVRDASGAALPNQVVTFAASNGIVMLNVTSALTNAAGSASVQVRPLSASTSGAEIVTASTTVNGSALQALASVQLTAQAPSVTATVTNSTISATSPATLTATVRDLTGNLLPGAVVTFSSQDGLATFTPASKVSDENGRAETVISPRTSTANGADTITAAVKVQGVAASFPTVVQFVTNKPSGTPTLSLVLSTTSISAASPATVTATLKDAQGIGVASQVVTFKVVRGLATTNIGTALTTASGNAIVVMSPANATSAGADEISATVTYAGVDLQQTQGFQVQGTAVTLGALTALADPVSPYGQTTLSLPITGASVTSPIGLTFTSACVGLGKATLSPASVTATTTPITVQFKDNGCGAVQPSDQIQAVVTATGATAALTLGITSPASSSIAFVQALPSQIYLRGSGFTESSVVTFQVNDAAGNPLPNVVVELRLQTGAGGVTMEGRNVEPVNPASTDPFKATSNALGQVSVRVNSGTVPTPVRVNARLATNTAIATVSSNLSVAIGLPSQLNFSFSQGTRNIEGYNIDGTSNSYQIIASDRSGNPVPAGTSINFVTEGGQIEAVKQIEIVNGIARTTANFVSSEPRPVDGRVTITAYALGEESFLDLDGNNRYDSNEPFQDLGNVFKDRNFDGSYDNRIDEFVPLTINNTDSCVVPTSPLLQLDPSIPSVGANTCDKSWSGAGQVYVRRAIETVLSTSGARPLWISTRGLSASCSKVTLQTGPLASQTSSFTQVGGDTWYGGTSDTLSFYAADANPGNPALGILPRLNPMAAGTVVSATSPTKGLTVTVGGGSRVPSTTEVSSVSIAYSFTDPAFDSGIIFVSFTSPSGASTSVGVPVQVGTRPSVCPP